MSTNKTKKITKTKTPIKNTTRKLPVFHHLTKTSRSRILGMQTYKLNCSKNLMLGYKTIKASEETSMDKDDFVHVVLSKLKDCDKPVIVKVYDETKSLCQVFANLKGYGTQAVPERHQFFKNLGSIIARISEKCERENGMM